MSKPSPSCTPSTNSYPLTLLHLLLRHMFPLHCVKPSKSELYATTRAPRVTRMATMWDRRQTLPYSTFSLYSASPILGRLVVYDLHLLQHRRLCLSDFQT